MTEKDIRSFYLKEIFKSFITALGCLYLATFEDIKNFACVLGFIASVMTVSWIKDYIEIKREIAEAINVYENAAFEKSNEDYEEFDDEDNEDYEDEDEEEYLE